MEKPYSEIRAQIRWQCRRGMLELELVLSAFFDKHFDSLSNDKKNTFKQLLEYPDPILYDWFLGRDIPEDPILNHIVQLMRASTVWKNCNSTLKPL